MVDEFIDLKLERLLLMIQSKFGTKCFTMSALVKKSDEQILHLLTELSDNRTPTPRRLGQYIIPHLEKDYAGLCIVCSHVREGTNQYRVLTMEQHQKWYQRLFRDMDVEDLKDCIANLYGKGQLLAMREYCIQLRKFIPKHLVDFGGLTPTYGDILIVPNGIRYRPFDPFKDKVDQVIGLCCVGQDVICVGKDMNEYLDLRHLNIVGESPTNVSSQQTTPVGTFRSWLRRFAQYVAIAIVVMVLLETYSLFMMKG